MKITFYSTGCPLCRVLEEKLQAKNIAYEEVTDQNAMQELGIERVPVLAIDGRLYEFLQANRMINQM